MIDVEKLFEEFARNNQAGTENSANRVLAKQAYLEGFAQALSYSRNVIEELRGGYDHPDDVVIGALSRIGEVRK